MQELLLRKRFELHIAELGAKFDPINAVSNTFSIYKERPYHNLEHIRDGYFHIKHLIGSSPLLMNTVATAWLFHDFYDPTSSEAIDRSKNGARFFLENCGLPSISIDHVCDFIEYTRNHDGASIKWPEASYAAINDADLLVLASTRNTYLEYLKNIRKEYNMYTDKEFMSGRKKFVEKMLGRERLFWFEYNTNYVTKILERSARENLKWELDRFKNIYSE
jgi:predicted metal-dependent HD superfamily phosphohydrolase